MLGYQSVYIFTNYVFVKILSLKSYQHWKMHIKQTISRLLYRSRCDMWTRMTILLCMYINVIFNLTMKRKIKCGFYKLIKVCIEILSYGTWHIIDIVACILLLVSIQIFFYHVSGICPNVMHSI